MPKQSYWIKSALGDFALVEGADQRDLWIIGRRWTLAVEPGPNDQVYVTHPEAGIGRIPYGALAAGWSDLGWAAGPPPEPVDITRNPALVDQAPTEPAKQTKAADGGEDKEK